MARKKFVLNLPFRQIKNSDATKRFANELFHTNKIALADLVAANKKNQHVLVYDLNGEVLAFLLFKDAGAHFHLELAETNRSFQTELKLGRKLITLVEEISIHFGYSKITLYSVAGKISLYKKMEYRITAKSVFDPTYGTLTMMEKKLS